MLSPTIEIEVVGTRGSCKLDALIDTGFTGYVCVPNKIAKDLGLVLCAIDEVELGDGNWNERLVFEGQVRLLGRLTPVLVILTKSETASIGTMMISDCRLEIDFVDKKIELTHKEL